MKPGICNLFGIYQNCNFTWQLSEKTQNILLCFQKYRSCIKVQDCYCSNTKHRKVPKLVMFMPLSFAAIFQFFFESVHIKHHIFALLSFLFCNNFLYHHKTLFIGLD